MIFKDRIHAGEKLVEKLEEYRSKPNTIVIGIPRGGVVVADIVAKQLNLPLDITCPRKISAPHNPEYAIGAVSETGEAFLNENVIEYLGVSKEYLDQEISYKTEQAKQRLDIYRRPLPERKLKGATVILVDDGLATGSTMKAAIKSMRFEGVKTIVAAIAVSSIDAKFDISKLSDKVVCLATPPNFAAVGQFYMDFSPTTDEEVIEILKNFYLV